MNNKSYPTIGKTAKKQAARRISRWKIGILMLGFLCVLCGKSYAQGTAQVRIVTTVPATCNANGNNSPVIWWKVGGVNPGIYTCVNGVPTYQTNTFGAGLTAKTMLYASAIPVAITSTAAPTDGQLLIGDTSDVPALGTLTNTANETLITNGAHSITIGLAVTLNHKVGANFNFLDPTDVTKRFEFDASGITTGTTRTVAVPDVNSAIPTPLAAVTNKCFSAMAASGVFAVIDCLTPAGTQTVTLKTITMGGGSTNLFADSADATKTAVLGLTNITTGTQRTINVPDANTTTTQARTAVDSLAVTGINGTTGAQTTATFDQLLSTTAAVDMNTAVATTLYTSPTGRSTIIKSVTVRNCSTSMTTASYSFGWTSAAFADVIANATHTELTGATLGTAIAAKTGFTVGTSTGTFKVLMNTLQGGAATCTMDVWGYTF